MTYACETLETSPYHDVSGYVLNIGWETHCCDDVNLNCWSAFTKERETKLHSTRIDLRNVVSLLSKFEGKVIPNTLCQSCVVEIILSYVIIPVWPK